MPNPLDDESWFEAVNNLTFRAEDLADPTASYVNTVFLAALQNKRNQVIFGRRGTGKTHLLLRLRNEMLDRFDDMRIVPAYVNGEELRESMHPYSDPAAIALAAYVEILKQTVSQLSLFIGDQINPSRLEKFFSGSKRNLISQVRDTANQLTKLLELGKVRMLPMGDVSTEFENLDEGVKKRRLSAEVNASASLSDPRSLGVKLDTSAEKVLTNTAKKLATRKIGGETYLPFGEISELIGRLLDALGNSSLAILVDEWSEAGDANVQPSLAHLLRLTAKHGICVKLACIPGRTNLFQPGSTDDGRNPIGFELGEDITADVDLDSIVFIDNDIKQLTEFFVALLQRHMAVHLPDLLEIDINTFSEEFLNTRLGQGRILAELCHASGAVPRDFITIFRQATSNQQAAGDKKMTIAHVRQAASNIYGGKRSNLANKKPELLALLDSIHRKVVIGQKTYFFLIEGPLAENSMIVELFTAKLIHKTPATWIDDSDRFISYTYYMIDYGTSIEFLRKKGAEAWDEMTHELPLHLSVPLKLLANSSSFKAMRDEVRERYVISFSASRLDAQPSALIVSREMIEASKPSAHSSKRKLKWLFRHSG